MPALPRLAALLGLLLSYTLQCALPALPRWTSLLRASLYYMLPCAVPALLLLTPFLGMLISYMLVTLLPFEFLLFVFPPLIWSVLVWGSVAQLALVLCTTQLVTGGGQKPLTCALRRSGVKSLPCKRRHPSVSESFPIRHLARFPSELSGPKVTAILPTAALAVAAAAASAAEHQPTVISLCTSYHLIISTRAYMHSNSIHAFKLLNTLSTSPEGAVHA